MDWKNTGGTNVRAAHADITLYDALGREVDLGAKDYCIYATYSTNGIAPGERYTEPEGDGYIIPTVPGVYERVGKVAVRLTRVVERIDEPE